MMTRNNDVGADVSHVFAGEGRARWVVGDTYTYKATTESTGGAFALLEASVPPGSGPPPHLHTTEDEAFYLLAGTLQILAGPDTFLARAGDFVFVPRGTVHGFTNPGVDAARALILLTPAGFERFFDEIGTPARPGEQAPPPSIDDLERIVEIAPRYGASIQIPTNAQPTQHLSG